jgi:hypothetical protein
MVNSTPAAASAPADFLPLQGVFEPSAVQQLPDGRFLVVEDEKSHPLSVLTIADDGSTDSAALGPGWFEDNEAFWKLDDLEGLSLDRCGRVLAITSHSRDGRGKAKGGREKLVRFRLEEDRVRDTRVVTDVKPALIAAHSELATAAAIEDVKTDGGLNIEALETSADGRHLLLGFRSPLRQGRALIAVIENPDGVFDGEPPHIGAELFALALGGQGLRGMAHVPGLDGYLLISGPVTRDEGAFQLWFWRGEATHQPRHVSVPGLPGFAHAEGICPARIRGTDYLLIVSDDGNRAKGHNARYLLLDPARLRIA